MASTNIEWNVIALDTVTNIPIESVGVDLYFTDQSSGKKSAKYCTTDAKGKCSVSIEADRGFFSMKTSEVNLTYKVNKKHYQKKFTSTVEKHSGVNLITFFLNPYLISELLIKGTDGNPIQGANVISNIENIGCTTGELGLCFFEHEETLPYLKIEKLGYSPLDVQELLTGGVRYSFTLKTQKETDAAKRKVNEEELEKNRLIENEIQMLATKKLEAIIKEERERRHLAFENMDNLEICALYGKLLRKESFEFNRNFMRENEDLPKIIYEVRRRKIKIDKITSTQEIIKIGMSTCNLYASRDKPISSTRSIGSWGEHVQYKYDGYFIYTENGRISSWQRLY